MRVNRWFENTIIESKAASLKFGCERPREIWSSLFVKVATHFRLRPPLVVYFHLILFHSYQGGPLSEPTSVFRIFRLHILYFVLFNSLPTPSPRDYKGEPFCWFLRILPGKKKAPQYILDFKTKNAFLEVFSHFCAVAMRKKLICKCEFILIALSYDSYVTGRSGGDPSENGW